MIFVYEVHLTVPVQDPQSDCYVQQPAFVGCGLRYSQLELIRHSELERINFMSDVSYIIIILYQTPHRPSPVVQSPVTSPATPKRQDGALCLCPPPLFFAVLSVAAHEQ